MTTQLAYSYPAAARILSASGYTDAEIAAFLTKHQNERLHPRVNFTTHQKAAVSTPES